MRKIGAWYVAWFVRMKNVNFGEILKNVKDAATFSVLITDIIAKPIMIVEIVKIFIV